MDFTPVLTSIGVLTIMLIATYLRHYGLIHIRAGYASLKRLYLEILIVAKLRRMDAGETTMLREFIEDYKVFKVTILNEVGSIKRGVYGDSVNGVRGLIQRQDEDEKRIRQLEQDTKEIKASVKGFRNKLIWTGAGFVAGLQALWEFIKWKSK